MKKVAVLILLTMIISCGRQKKQTQEPSIPIKVGWSLWSGWYPMAIAQELKLFEKHGANIQPILYTNYMDIFPDLASGKIDAGFSGLYEILKSNIPDIKVVLITDHSNGAEGLFVVPEIKNPAQLKGKRIGIQGQLSGSEFVVNTYLRRYGLSRSDIIIVDIPPEEVLNNMPNNLDGGYTWDPFLSQAVNKGYNVLFTTADMNGLVIDIVAFQGLIAKERPNEIKGFIDAWFEAIDFWEKEPDKAREIILKVTGIKPEEVTLQGCQLFNRNDNLAAFNKSNQKESIYSAGNTQIQFLISVGDASSIPDLNNILEPSFINMK